MGTSFLQLQVLCIISQSSVNSSWSYSTESSIRVKIIGFSARVTLKFDEWYWKATGHFFYATSSFVHLLMAICVIELVLQSGNTQFASKSLVFGPCDLDICSLIDELENQQGTSSMPPQSLFIISMPSVKSNPQFGSQLSIFRPFRP